MGFSMHAMAQALVRASVLEQEPQASPAAIRRAPFLRFYGADFDGPTREKIAVGGHDGSSESAALPARESVTGER